MQKRKLLAIGTAKYQDSEFEDLKHVPEAVQTMVDAFDTLGFDTQSLLNPTKTVLEETIETWLNKEEWSKDDVAVLYRTGHGISATAGHYLVMTDSVADRYAKAVETRFIASALGDNPALGHLLVLLDTCYSESGGDTIVGLAAAMKQQWSSRIGRQYWIVTSARSKQEAQQLVFAQAFTQALTELRGSFGTQSRSIPLTVVVGATNELLGRPRFSVTHRATVTPLVPAPGDDGFFDNPGYASSPAALVPTEVAPANEMLAHWIPRARGGTVDRGPSHFKGRELLIEEILTWASDTSQAALMVVTGEPGTGKSALLAQFVAPHGRSDGPRAAGKPVALARAIHAKGLTTENIRRRVEDLIRSEIARTGARPVVIIDALDEADDIGNFETKVLKPLISSGVRIAVGARPSLAKSFGLNCVAINLDQHLESDAVLAYVDSLLVADPSSPYVQGNKPTHAVAAAIATISGPSFLLAGQIARPLTRMRRRLDVTEIETTLQSFGSLANVFEADLRRIGDDNGLVRELLTALAWSRGAGLPWEGIWPAVCSALFSPRIYTDADVRGALDSASDYIVEMLIDGRSYYRLYHELFSEHLRRGKADVVAHAQITRALIDMTPTNEQGERSWDHAHPYVLAFLTEHAARGDKLDGLLLDPLASLALNPDRLGVALGSISNRPIGTNESAVMSYLGNLQVQGEHHMSQLALAALQTGATELATKAIELARQSAWWPQWARWASIPAHTVIARLQETVLGIHVVKYKTEALAIAASKDGDVDCSLISSGRQLWHRNFEGVSALAAAGGLVAVGTGPGPIYILAASDGREVAMFPGPTRGEDPLTYALAIHVDGSEILVAAGSYNENDQDDALTSSGGLLRLWHLDEPERPVWTKPAFRLGVRSLGFRSTAQGLQLVAGGDPFRGPNGTESVVRIFNAETGEKLHQAPPGLGAYASAVASPDGSILILVSGYNGSVVRWIPDTGETLAKTGYMTTGVSTLTPDGSVWLVGTYNRGLLALSPKTLGALHEEMSNVVVPSALAISIESDRIFVLSGSRNGEVTRWDLSAITELGLNGRRPHIHDITIVRHDLVAYSVDDGSGAIETIQLNNGEVVSRVEQVHPSMLHSMGSSGAVYVGRASGSVDIFDADTLACHHPALSLHDNKITGMTDADGLLITCGYDARVHVTDPQHSSVYPPLVHADYKVRPLVQVRVVDIDGVRMLVALDYDGEFVFWRWKEVLEGNVDVFSKDGRNAAHKFYVQASNVEARSFCAWQSPEETVFIRPGINGSIEMWSYSDQRTELWEAHRTQISHVEMLGSEVLLTAGCDGLLRAWRLPMRQLIAEARLGAPITFLCSVKQHAVLVGTESGLVLLNLPAADAN